MTVIQNNPPNNGNNGMGFFLSMILIIAFFIFLFYYGVPIMRNLGTPQINVPSKIDVNVNNK